MIKHKLLCGAKRDLLPADDVAAALWHPLKAFSAPFYGSAGFISSCSAHICTQKVHKDSLSGRLFSFTASPCGPWAYSSSGIKQTKKASWMFTCIKIKHTTTGGHQKLAHAYIVKKTSKDEVQIFSTQMRFLRVAVLALTFLSAAALLNYYRRYF